MQMQTFTESKQKRCVCVYQEGVLTLTGQDKAADTNTHTRTQ